MNLQNIIDILRDSDQVVLDQALSYSFQPFRNEHFLISQFDCSTRYLHVALVAMFALSLTSLIYISYHICHMLTS